MTKFFKTLEELKASLPTTFNSWKNSSVFDSGKAMRSIGEAEAPKTVIVINDNNLEKYLYTPKIVGCSGFFTHSLSYKFKLLKSCPISEYKSLIDAKANFEDILPQEYARKSTCFQWAESEYNMIEGSFFAPKTAIVIDGDNFQEIVYTPMKGECTKKGWFSSSTWKVDYTSEVLNEISVDGALADFA